MSGSANKYRAITRGLVLATSLLFLDTITAYAQGTAHTRHYRVYLGLRSLQNAGEQQQPFNTEGAAQSGIGRLITAAIFRRSNGKRINKASVTVIVIPNDGTQSVHKTMHPVSIGGDVTFEAVVALSPGTYTIRIAIKGPEDVRQEIATFQQGVS